MNKIYVFNPHSYQFMFEDSFNEILTKLQKTMEIDFPIELCVTFVNKHEIQEKNRVLRSHDKITDVISVPSYPLEMAAQIRYWLIGDIFLCYEVIEEQAISYNHSFKREFLYLFTHSLVHLFGYDHKTLEDEERMNKIVEDVMKEIGVTRYE